ncbi:MAG: TIGR04282 family arsenosugar biosynthesis glycosyltransferase [Gammaproteobacteria bacterium]
MTTTPSGVSARASRGAAPLIVVMARAPVPGRVKSRLAQSIGAERACTVYVALLERTVAVAMSVGVEVTLAVTPDASHPVFRRLRRRWPTLRFHRQGRGDLGRRMLRVFRRDNDRAVLLLGSDCPIFTVHGLRAALAAIDTERLVFIPARDGGYVGLGGVRVPGNVFHGPRWGSARVLAPSLSRLGSAGKAYRLMPTLWDVDERVDWRRWRRLRRGA